MPVEDRLGHARLPGDLGGGRAAVAALREHAAGVLHDRRTALLGAQADAGLAQAATSETCTGSSAGSSSGLRSVTTATIAAVKAIPAATSSDRWKPSMNSPTARGSVTGLWTYEATIAPMIAIPSEPPTWRMLFSTAEPTPALSGRTELIAAAVVGAIAADIPTPPSSIAGRSVQKVSWT